MSIFLQPEDGDSYEYITDGALMQCTAGALPCPIKAKDIRLWYMQNNQTTLC